MKQFLLCIYLLLLAACHAQPKLTESCNFTHIPVTSTELSRNEIYTGSGQHVEIQFFNEDAPNPVDVFPEPKVIIKNKFSNKQCAITEGHGIWVGESVYLSDKESVLLLEEYSGSNASLLFFDTQSCHQLAVIDISELRWIISSDRLRLGALCRGDTLESCAEKQEYHFTSQCLPIR